MNLDYFHSKISDLQTKILSLRRNLHDPTDTLNEVIEELSSAPMELDVAQREIFQQSENLQTGYLAIETEHRRYQEFFDFAPGGNSIDELESKQFVGPFEERGAYENSCCG